MMWLTIMDYFWFTLSMVNLFVLVQPVVDKNTSIIIIMHVNMIAHHWFYKFSMTEKVENCFLFQYIPLIIIKWTDFNWLDYVNFLNNLLWIQTTSIITIMLTLLYKLSMTVKLGWCFLGEYDVDLKNETD